MPVEDFLSRYQREYDYYQEIARLCALQCETELERNGIRAIVTFRAKRPDRLREKVEKRNGQHSYENVDDIYQDIVDLAGVRVALYFPGDKVEVDRIIRSLFTIEKDKSFPRDSDSQVVSGTYAKRFVGYTAIHYHVRLREENLPEADKRYANSLIEIQVASVLMHGWAEVEHDLAYKPLSGDVSDDEYAILDELNGLVLAGEIALERLQKAVQQRASKRGKHFTNHYELAAYLYDAIRSSPANGPNEPVMVRADVLLRFLQLANLDRTDPLV
ncbi:MAG: RelA/SpoT domain-containing protein, partial [Chloroflexi bacterium]|nr:RelA/SpoT domain-containing protein [Chloroflexota bacterium]